MVATADPKKPRALSREEVFEAASPLVVKLVASLLRRHPALRSHREDMEQAAYLELLSIAGDYDPGQGAGPRTFAGHRLRGFLIDYLRSMRNGCGMRGKVFQEHRLAGRHVPTCQSIHAPLRHGDRDGNIADRPRAMAESVGVTDAPVCDSPAEELAAAIRRTGAMLTTTERDLIVAYMAGESSMKEIATARGQSESWVSLCVARGIVQIRDAMTRRGMKNFDN